MKAIVLTAYGEVDKLELRDVPNPKVGPNDVEVRMAGASVNPIDWKLRSGALKAFMPLDLPAILGRDASGVVIAIGKAVTAFKIGARVVGLVNGGYAEIVVAPVLAWAEIPASMDIVDAGALPLVLLTGAQLVEEAVDAHEGDVVLVTGATGSVGRAAVYAAQTRGAAVWAGVRGSQKLAAAKLGVHGVVALDDDADIARLPTLDAIADTVGGETIQKLLGKLKAGGTIGSIVGEPSGAKERGFVVHGMMTHPDAKRLGALALAVAEGQLVIPIAQKLALSEARKAQKLAEDGAGGKVVLKG